MAYLDEENYYLAKKMRRKYLLKVNPLLKNRPGYVKEPTDLMILQHAHLGFFGTPFRPRWKPRMNHMKGKPYGYLLVAIDR